MLTPQEEVVLRRIVQENTPMSRTPVKYGERPVVDQDAWLQRELDKCEKIHTANPNEDWQVINLVKHTMKKGEFLTQWYARVLLGRAQVLTMTKDQITRFAALADERNANDGGYRPPQAFSEPQARPAARRVPMVMVG